MNLETKYRDKCAVVIGGRGQLGSKIVQDLKELNFGGVKVCETGDSLDSFRKLAEKSNVIFSAIDDLQTKIRLESVKDLIKPTFWILDGSSRKTELVDLYRRMDQLGVSVVSTHFGAVPTQPRMGIKTWLCTVGKNSTEALGLAIDIFSKDQASVQIIPIEEHHKVEDVQRIAFATAHSFAATLREYGMTLEEFDKFATLNAELLAVFAGRSLGQGVDIPSEIVSNPARKAKLIQAMNRAWKNYKFNLRSRDEIKDFMQTNITYHDNPKGIVAKMFKRGGFTGARYANLRLFSMALSIFNDVPGVLRRIAEVFENHKANLTAIDSMQKTITEAEVVQFGMSLKENIGRGVDFHLGIDPRTINYEKEASIKSDLKSLGAIIGDEDAL